MVLEHAPVTGLTLIIGVFSSALTMDRYLRRLSHAGATMVSAAATVAAASTRPSSVLGSLLRLSLESIPFGLHGTSLLDIALTSSVVYQLRGGARGGGASTFLAFMLAAAGLGIGVMHLLVTESTTPALDVAALRVLSAGASLVPLVALVTRYVAEVPNVHGAALPIPFTQLRVTEKALVIVPLLKLVLAPNRELQASGFKRRAIHMDIGGWNRLLLGLVGVLFAVFATKSAVLRCTLRAVARYVCRPVLLFLDPVLHGLFTTRAHVQHVLPKRLAQAQAAAQRAHHAGVGAATHRHRHHVNNNHNSNDGGGGGGMTRRGSRDAAQHPVFATSTAHALDAQPLVGDGGRYMVDSLAGPSLTHRFERHDVSSVRDAGGVLAGRARGAETAPGEDAVAQIEELGLGLTRAQIVRALAATHGDVNAAVHVLIDS